MNLAQLLRNLEQFGPWEAVGDAVRTEFQVGDINRPGFRIADLRGCYLPDRPAIAALLGAAPRLATALIRAEAFIAGFEGDPTQEGVTEMLKSIREALEAAGMPTAPSPSPPESPKGTS